VNKASDVTFAASMVERVIEEQAAGNANLAQEIRAKIARNIGDSLRGVIPGPDSATKVKEVLIEEGLWSPCLEVGIGPDAEVFTKALRYRRSAGLRQPVAQAPEPLWIP
jgi:fumarylacetoacetate (FAA) hydrolase family protein